MLSKILSEATRERAVNRAITHFISDDIEDDDDIVLSLVDTDNANKPEDDDIDEDTLMRIFSVLDNGTDELGAHNLVDTEISNETDETVAESTLNEMKANALILANYLYEAVTGKKGQDKDTTEFCEDCGKADEACNSSMKNQSEEYDDDDWDDDWDDELLADAYRV